MATADPRASKRNIAARASNARHNSGVFVVVVLALVFFALLAAIIVFSRGKKPPQTAQAETLSVLPLHARLRTEPSAKAPVVASEEQAAKLIVLEDRNDWVRVQDADGLTGWVERNLLERTSERDRRLARYEAIKKLPVLGGVATERTPLYAGPGIFYPLAGELAADTQVKVYTRDHDFYAIDHNGQIAYADIDAIDVSSAGTRQLEVNTAATDTAATTTDTAAATAPPETASTETNPPPPPASEPQGVPQSAPAAADNSGVYAAVPAGGTQPEEVERAVPRYPMLARRAGIAGPVVVRGIVRKDGTIDNVEIIKDLPYGLGEAAREAVERWKFRPASLHGEPIDVYYTVTVNFRLTP